MKVSLLLVLMFSAYQIHADGIKVLKPFVKSKNEIICSEIKGKIGHKLEKNSKGELRYLKVDTHSGKILKDTIFDTSLLLKGEGHNDAIRIGQDNVEVYNMVDGHLEEVLELSSVCSIIE